MERIDTRKNSIFFFHLASKFALLLFYYLVAFFSSFRFVSFRFVSFRFVTSQLSRTNKLSESDRIFVPIKVTANNFRGTVISLFFFFSFSGRINIKSIFLKEEIRSWLTAIHGKSNASEFLNSINYNQLEGANRAKWALSIFINLSSSPISSNLLELFEPHNHHEIHGIFLLVANFFLFLLFL